MTNKMVEMAKIEHKGKKLILFLKKNMNREKPMGAKMLKSFCCLFTSKQ